MLSKLTNVQTASGIPLSVTFEKIADSLERIAICLEADKNQ